MKITLSVFATLLSFSAMAKDFAAYSTVNDFFVLNEEGREIYKENASNIKNVDLREDLAAIQTITNNVTVVNSDGVVVVDAAYGEQYKITSKYVATYGGQQMVIVDKTGKTVLKKSMVSAVGISDSFFAYRENRSGNYLVVTDESGKEIYTQFNNGEAKISNNFIFARDNYGYLSLMDKNANRLYYSNNIRDYKISNSFATTTDNYDFTQVYDVEGNIVLSGFNINLITVLDEVIAIFPFAYLRKKVN